MDYLAEFLRQQTLVIVGACSRCYAIRCETPAANRTPCDRCRRPADQAVFAMVDGRVVWDHEHLCERCSARGRRTSGWTEVSGSPRLPRQVRGARGRKAEGRYRGPRAAGPEGARTSDSEGR